MEAACGRGGDARLGLKADTGAVGLYQGDNFEDSSAIRAYVEWGTTGHGQSSVAATAGIWDGGAVTP